MLNYIGKRVLLGLVSLVLLIIIVFFLMGLNKSSPITIDQFEGENKEADYKNALAAANLDKDIVTRFGIYFSGLFKGDLGLVYNPRVMGANTVQEIFFEPLKYTIIITASAFIFGVLIGSILGFWAGYKTGKLPDIVINIFVIGISAVPGFVWAAVAIIIGPELGLPASFLDWSNYDLGLSLLSVINPIVVLTMLSIGGLTFFIRNEIKNILESDYIMNARAKGLSEKHIFKNYVVRNASIPMLSIIIPWFFTLLAGSFVIEQFFGIPGSSSILILAIRNNEANIVMFQVLFFGAISFFVKILLDVSYVFIDPRIKYKSATEIRKFGIIPMVRRIIARRKGRIVQNG